MILELADIRIQPGTQSAFEKAAKNGLDSVLAKAEGFISYEIQKCIESPLRYVLLIQWENLEAHTVGFRTSPAHGEWRAIVGPFFAQAPFVEHFSLISVHKERQIN